MTKQRTLTASRGEGMGEEPVIIQAGPVGIVLGGKTRTDISKLRFLVKLGGSYEYVRNGSLRILCSEKKKDVAEAAADPKVKGKVKALGECKGKHYLAADLEAAVHLLKKKDSRLKAVEEAELLQLLQEGAK